VAPGWLATEEDLCCLYRLALEKGLAGTSYHAVADEGATMAEMKADQDRPDSRHQPPGLFQDLAFRTLLRS
jgi:hypothetical protein